jgi:hypothetical protein
MTGTRPLTRPRSLRPGALGVMKTCTRPARKTTPVPALPHRHDPSTDTRPVTFERYFDRNTCYESVPVVVLSVLAELDRSDR